MEKEKNKVYSFLKIAFSTVVNFLYHPTILGKENIPEDGPIIFAGNHRHSFDPILVIMSTKRVVHFLAKKELFKGLRGKMLLKAGLIRVNRSRPNPSVIKKSVKILQDDGIVGIFPEGTRNKTDEELLPFKFGAVSIAQKTNSVIVPFAIRGKYKPFRKGLTLEFGKPIKVGNSNLEDANKYLRNQVLELFRK